MAFALASPNHFSFLTKEKKKVCHATKMRKLLGYYIHTYQILPEILFLSDIINLNFAGFNE